MIRILPLGVSTIVLFSTLCCGQPSAFCFLGIKVINCKGTLVGKANLKIDPRN